MFTLNFHKQFAQAVETGKKRQTIRALRKDGRKPAVGDDLRLYTGMRTSDCRRLADATCMAVLPVKILERGPDWVVFVGGNELSFCEQIDFARDDGFNSRAEFLGFFNKAHGLPFDGLMIQWGEPMPSNKQ